MTLPDDQNSVPAYQSYRFKCPHCSTVAAQGWAKPDRLIKFSGHKNNYGQSNDFQISMCAHCDKMCVWIEGDMVYPLQITVPPPNNDLPDEIKSDYLEAATILKLSPRGSAALLRLAIQKLCQHLGGSGKNINNDIKLLVSKGLPEPIQQALDTVRVVGNNAVHPGTINFDDDSKTAEHLFGLINIIADFMITRPIHVASVYKSVVPKSQQEAIDKRDGK